MEHEAEQQRIIAYQRGWNDATCGKPQAMYQSILYSVGYFEAMKGAPKRFETEIEVEA